jgi:hypothetical protein
MLETLCHNDKQNVENNPTQKQLIAQQGTTGNGQCKLISCLRKQTAEKFFTNAVFYQESFSSYVK